MPSLAELEVAAPDLARVVRERFTAHTHHTLATLRRDGSPRISGTEVELSDGELWLGSMPGALKARDLQRDPRFALHSASEDPPAWTHDAKVAGVAVEVAHDADHHRFRLDIREASTVGVADKRLVIELWTPAGGVRRIERG